MPQFNKVQHGDWMNNDIPNKSVQLIIADPPYFEIKMPTNVSHCINLNPNYSDDYKTRMGDAQCKHV